MLYPVTKKHTANTCFQEVETAEYLMLDKNLWSLRIEEGGRDVLPEVLPCHWNGILQGGFVV